ncbi:MAG: hypothetical protein QG588_277, partial [Candidatus Poribacteria bacterium]|nr:hypothetical protein [Candidatus Poribacteria bacterium]
EQYSQELSSISQSSSSLQGIMGLNVDKFVEGDKNNSTVYAVAYVNRADLKNIYSQERRDLIQQINEIITDAQAYVSKSEIMDAVSKYLSLYPLYERLKESEMVLLVVKESKSIDTAFNELDAETQGANKITLMSQTEVTNKIDRLLSESLGSLDDVARAVVMRLSKQIPMPTGKVLVVPLIYQDTKMGSSFARHFRAELENQIIQLANWKVAEQVQSFSPKSSQIMRDLAKESGAELILSGTYWERGNEVKLMVSIREINSGKVLAGTEITFDPQILPENVNLKPDNFESALVAQGAFGQGEIVSGQLQVESWTNKGNENLIYTAGETMKVFVRVNREAHVRFLYILADGRWTLLYDDLYIDKSKVNRAVEIPDEFECAPPFGAEMLVVIARTEEFEPLETVEEDGYYFVNKEPVIPQATARSLASKVRNEKGMKSKKQSQIAIIDSNLHADLNSNDITDNLRQEFEKNKITLSQNTTLSTLVQDSEWLINDTNNQQTYLVKLEEGKLGIYKIQQAETKLVLTTMEQ